jgi:hypothetical protein
MRLIAANAKVIGGWLIGAIFVVLSGCGGGSGSSTSETQPPPVQNADGIWRGVTVDKDRTCEVYMMTCSGEMVAFSSSSSDCAAVYKGSFTVNGNNFSGESEAYAIGGEKGGSVTFSGTVAEQSNMSGNFSSSNGNTGTYDFTYGQGSDHPSSLEQVEGTWAYSYPDGSFVNAVIDSQGEISGSDSNGCVFTGVISLMDPDKSIYSIDYDVSQCAAHNGSYDGLAALGTDTDTRNDEIIFVAASGDYSALHVLMRQ